VNLWLEEPRLRVRRKPAVPRRSRTGRASSAPCLATLAACTDSGIPNLKLNSAMKDLLAGRVPIALHSDNPVDSVPEQRQVCQSQIVSAKGFTPERCAISVPYASVPSALK
jgi:hypothetical protein